MKKQLIILFFLIGSCMVNGQIISGKVLDKEEVPIVYATIQITDNHGVITNEEGLFEIDTSGFKPNDKVIISFLGYKQLTFTLSEFTSKNYYLEEEINTLDDVFVTGEKLSVEEIMQKVQENAAKNYVNTNFKQQVFHRITDANTFKDFDLDIEKSNLLKKSEIKKLNSSIDNLFLPIINQTNTSYSEVLANYYVGEKATKLDVIKRVNLINKEADRSQEKLSNLFLDVIAKHLEKGATYKVKSGLFKLDDSLSIDSDIKKDFYKEEFKTSYLKTNYNTIFENNSIAENGKFDFIFKTNKYDYLIVNTVYLEGDLLYVIDFEPRKSSAKFKGTIYVNADDFAIVKAKFALAEGKVSRKVNLKLVLGVKMVENIFSSEILFQKNTKGQYFFKFIKLEVGTYAYIHRPFKFTKNRKDKSEEKKMLKLDLTMQMNALQKNELFFINSEEITNANFKNFKEKATHKVDYIPKYDPAIWKDYNVLSPVQEIKDYDTGE